MAADQGSGSNSNPLKSIDEMLGDDDNSSPRQSSHEGIGASSVISPRPGRFRRPPKPTNRTSSNESSRRNSIVMSEDGSSDFTAVPTGELAEEVEKRALLSPTMTLEQEAETNTLRRKASGSLEITRSGKPDDITSSEELDSKRLPKQQCGELENEIKKLRSKIADMDTLLQKVDDREAEAEEQISKHQEAKEAAEERAVSYMKDADEAAHKLRDSDRELQDAKAEIKLLQVEKDKVPVLEKDLEDLNNAFNILYSVQDENASLKAAAKVQQQLTQKIIAAQERAERDLREANATIQELQEQLDMVSDLLDFIQKMNDERSAEQLSFVDERIGGLLDERRFGKPLPTRSAPAPNSMPNSLPPSPTPGIQQQYQRLDDIVSLGSGNAMHSRQQSMTASPVTFADLGPSANPRSSLPERVYDHLETPRPPIARRVSMSSHKPGVPSNLRKVIKVDSPADDDSIVADLIESQGNSHTSTILSPRAMSVCNTQNEHDSIKQNLVSRSLWDEERDQAVLPVALEQHFLLAKPQHIHALNQEDETPKPKKTMALSAINTNINEYAVEDTIAISSAIESKAMAFPPSPGLRKRRCAASSTESSSKQTSSSRPSPSQGLRPVSAELENDAGEVVRDYSDPVAVSERKRTMRELKMTLEAGDDPMLLGVLNNLHQDAHVDTVNATEQPQNVNHRRPEDTNTTTRPSNQTHDSSSDTNTSTTNSSIQGDETSPQVPPKDPFRGPDPPFSPDTEAKIRAKRKSVLVPAVSALVLLLIATLLCANVNAYCRFLNLDPRKFPPKFRFDWVTIDNKTWVGYPADDTHVRSGLTFSIYTPMSTEIVHGEELTRTVTQERWTTKTKTKEYLAPRTRYRNSTETVTEIETSVVTNAVTSTIQRILTSTLTMTHVSISTVTTQLPALTSTITTQLPASTMTTTVTESLPIEIKTVTSTYTPPAAPPIINNDLPPTRSSPIHISPQRPSYHIALPPFEASLPSNTHPPPFPPVPVSSMECRCIAPSWRPLTNEEIDANHQAYLVREGRLRRDADRMRYVPGYTGLMEPMRWWWALGLFEIERWLLS
jgi:hypothetical protein